MKRRKVTFYLDERDHKVAMEICRRTGLPIGRLFMICLLEHHRWAKRKAKQAMRKLRGNTE